MQLFCLIKTIESVHDIFKELEYLDVKFELHKEIKTKIRYNTSNDWSEAYEGAN